MTFQHKHLALQVREIARQFPEKIAIQYLGKTVTYRRLETVSNGIAHVLQEKLRNTSSLKANQPVEPVLVLLDRSPGLIEVILGILKCGLVFVPIDPRTPAGRVKQLLAETGARWLITSHEYEEKCREIVPGQGEAVDLVLVEHIREEVDEFEAVYNKYAYIYFTSGSTGIPKGVLGRHQSLDHFIQWEIREFGIDETVNVSQLTNPSFDPYLRDMFVPLTTGGTCCIPDYDTLMDPAALTAWLETSHIHLVHIVPTLFKTITRSIDIAKPEALPGLKYVFLAGELLRGNDLKKWYEVFAGRIQLVNLYGATETTLVKFFYRLNPEDAHKTIIPVGQPIPGAQALILDEEKQACLPGNIGEVYIRTPFISSGYYKDPELTKKVFIKNPFGTNDRDIIYKTGDLGRLLPGGDLELVGRIDHQVKLRGIRIELGEIENRLLEHPGIKEAVVLAREDESGEKYLCTYFIPANHASANGIAPPVGGAELKQYLSRYLPQYMVPSYYMQLETIPLTLNGKVDRKKLPEPQLTAAAEYAAPGNDIETALVEIWSEVLGRDRQSVPPGQEGNPLIGIDDNFFELGGHSLRAAEMVAKVHKKLDAKVPLSVVFDTPSIRKLAEYIRETKGGTFLSIAAVEKKEYYSLSSAQKRLYILCRGNPDDTGYNIPCWSGLEEPLGLEKVKECFRQLIRRHDSLRTSFHLLAGGPVQRIHDHVAIEISHHPVSLDGPAPAAQLPDPVAETIKGFIRPFDLSQAPLLRVGIAELHTVNASPSPTASAVKRKNSGGRYILMVDIHHIVSDGVSMNMLIKEFLALYRGEELPRLKLQYKDFAEWHNTGLKSGEIRKQEDYWEKVFSAGVPVLNLPIDNPRSLPRSYAGEVIIFQVTIEESRKLRELARSGGVTMYMLLLAITDVFLSRLTGQEDLVVGTVAAGRRHADLEPVIGMFVNTLALRMNPAEHLTFNEFLHQVKQRTLEAFENQDYQFEDLVEKIMPGQRDPSRNPLFDVLFISYSNPVSREPGREPSNNERTEPEENQGKEEPWLRTGVNRFEDGKSKFDLIIGAFDREAAISFSIVYQIQLFNQETIRRLIGYFKEVISMVVENQENQLKDIKVSHYLESAVSGDVYDSMESEGEF